MLAWSTRSSCSRNVKRVFSFWAECVGTQGSSFRFCALRLDHKRALRNRDTRSIRDPARHKGCPHIHPPISHPSNLITAAGRTCLYSNHWFGSLGQSSTSGDSCFSEEAGGKRLSNLSS